MRSQIGGTQASPPSSSTGRQRFCSATRTGLSACWTGAAREPQPSPPPERSVAVPSGASADAAPAPPRTAALHGIVRNGPKSEPLGGVLVEIRSGDGTRQIALTRTATDGTFSIDALEAGQYLVTYRYFNNGLDGSLTNIVTLHEDETAHADLNMNMFPRQYGHGAKPYGAPPARRRPV